MKSIGFTLLHPSNSQTCTLFPFLALLIRCVVGVYVTSSSTRIPGILAVVVESRREGPACDAFVVDLLDRRFDELTVACSSWMGRFDEEDGLLERRDVERDGPVVEEREEGGGL